MDNVSICICLQRKILFDTKGLTDECLLLVSSFSARNWRRDEISFIENSTLLTKCGIGQSVIRITFYFYYVQRRRMLFRGLPRNRKNDRFLDRFMQSHQVLLHGLIIDHEIDHFCCYATGSQNCILRTSIKEILFLHKDSHRSIERCSVECYCP